MNTQRKDLLAVAVKSLSEPRSHEKAMIRLKNLGFRIEQPRPGHWVLSKADKPARIYLYGSAELSAFANDRALAYACGFSPSNICQHTLEFAHDTPCALSG